MLTRLGVLLSDLNVVVLDRKAPHATHVSFGAPFELPLSNNFGSKMHFKVQYYVSGRHAENIGLDPTNQYNVAGFSDPPLRLSPNAFEFAARRVQVWIDDAITNNLSQWPDMYCYGTNPEMVSQRGIMKAVCWFYGQGNLEHVGARKTLRSAISLTMNEFLRDHGLFVPDEDKTGLFGLGNLQGAIVYPRLVTKYIKAAALPQLRENLKETLEGLNDLLWEESKQQYATIFAVVFILLRVAADIQSAACMKIKLANERKLRHIDDCGDEEILSVHDVEVAVKDIEEQIIDFVVNIFRCKFKVVYDRMFNPFLKNKNMSDLPQNDQIFLEMVRNAVTREDGEFPKRRIFDQKQHISNCGFL